MAKHITQRLSNGKTYCPECGFWQKAIIIHCTGAPTAVPREFNRYGEEMKTILRPQNKCEHKRTASIFEQHRNSDLLFRCLNCKATKNRAGMWGYHKLDRAKRPARRVNSGVIF